MFSGQMYKRAEAEHEYKAWDPWVVSAQTKVYKPAGFDTDSINVISFRRSTLFKGKPTMPAVAITVKDLAKGVAMWSKGYDALDLT